MTPATQQLIDAAFEMMAATKKEYPKEGTPEFFALTDVAHRLECAGIAYKRELVAAKESVPPDRDPVPFKICHKCSHEFEVVGGNDNSGFTSSFQNCPHCQTRNDTWIHIPLNPERHRKNSRNADYSKPLPGIPVPPEARAVEAAEKLHPEFSRSWIEQLESGDNNGASPARMEEYREMFRKAQAERDRIAAIIQRTCFPPSEGEEWAIRAAREYLAPAETPEGLTPSEADVLQLAAVFLKHFASRPTAAREDTARLENVRRALRAVFPGFESDVSNNGCDVLNEAYKLIVQEFAAIDAAMQQGGKTP